MQIISTQVVNASIACFNRNFKRYPEIKLIAISGNHDDSNKNLIDSPAVSALEHLAEIFPDNFILLDEFKSHFATDGGNIIVGLPYFEYPEHFRSALDNLDAWLDEKEPETKNTLQELLGGRLILLMHQTVASGLPIEDDIEATDPLFDNFDFIFNGHIHDGSQVTDKFINVGSPMARDAGDIGKKKGFWIVDLDDPVNTISFKDITDKYPQFLYKTVGEPLTEWEKQQYVIFQPAVTAENTSDNLRNEKFNTNLAPAKILENYCSEILPKDEIKDKLAYGITLLQS